MNIVPEKNEKSFSCGILVILLVGIIFSLRKLLEQLIDQQKRKFWTLNKCCIQWGIMQA